MDYITACFGEELNTFTKERMAELFIQSFIDRSTKMLQETGKSIPVSYFGVFVISNFAKLDQEAKDDFFSIVSVRFIEDRVMKMDLSEVVNKKDVKIVSFFLDSIKKSADNSMALINACKNNSIEIVKLLIERGCNTDNLEALKCCIENDCVEMIEILLDRGCNKYVCEAIGISKKGSKVQEYLSIKYPGDVFRMSLLSVD